MSAIIEYKNPIIEQRADPWIIKHRGYYYFTASVPEYDRFEVRKSTTIQGLSTAKPKIIWKKHESGIMSKNIWAPELHFINKKWYIYFAAARTDSEFDHRMYVLENDSTDPLNDNCVEKGKIITEWDSFSLDETTFEHNGILYLIWPQKDPSIDGNSNLYISKMKNPWTLEGKQIMLTKPGY
jgi:GH43 family beta-xylosidase